jgi:hypothetical protein
MPDQTRTAFALSPDCGFVHTLSARQSSSNSCPVCSVALSTFRAVGLFPKGAVENPNQYSKSFTSCFGIQVYEPAAIPAFAGQSGKYLCPDKTLSLTYGLGYANLNSETGGCAKRMPRYSLTSGCHPDAWPCTKPLVVLTGSPIFHEATCLERRTATHNESV